MGRGTGVATRAASKKSRADSDPDTPTKKPTRTTRTTRLATRTMSQVKVTESSADSIASLSEDEGNDDASPQAATTKSKPAAKHESSADALDRRRRAGKPWIWSSGSEASVEDDKPLTIIDPAVEAEEETKRALAKYNAKMFRFNYPKLDLNKYSRLYDEIDLPQRQANNIMSDTESEDESKNECDDDSEDESEDGEQLKVKYPYQSKVQGEDQSDADAEDESDAESQPNDQSAMEQESQERSEIEEQEQEDDDHSASDDQEQEDDDQSGSDEQEQENDDQSEVEHEEEVEEDYEDSYEAYLAELNNVGAPKPPSKDLTDEQAAKYKAEGHWRFGEDGYDYDKDTLFYGCVWPFPREKKICKLIASYLLPEDRAIKIKAITKSGVVGATFDDDYPHEDKVMVSKLVFALGCWRSMYKCIGGAAYTMLRFEFNKTTAIKALLTGFRRWEATNGMPSILSGIKTITVNNSFGQQFGDWLSDMANFEVFDGEDKIMELAGLKEIVFIGMPSGRSVEDTGTCYMPSSLEKLRALATKLKKREMQTYVVKLGGEEEARVDVRLIYGRDLYDEEYGVQDDEVLLDPSHEMKNYRKALSRNNVNKQQNASRRLSAGLAAQSPGKGNAKKRRNASDSSSRQTKKSPKKVEGGHRFRRPSDEIYIDQARDKSPEAAIDAEMQDLVKRTMFSKNAMKGFQDKLKNKSQEQKEAYREAMHRLLDLELADK